MKHILLIAWAMTVFSFNAMATETYPEIYDYAKEKKECEAVVQPSVSYKFYTQTDNGMTFISSGTMKRKSLYVIDNIVSIKSTDDIEVCTVPHHVDDSEHEGPIPVICTGYDCYEVKK